MEHAEGIGDISNISLIEQIPLSEREPATSTYELLRRSAATWPEKAALCFSLSPEYPNRLFRYTYGELLENVHRTANALSHLAGVEQPVTAYLLPLLPQTHFLIWGGEAAGIVTAVNPLLDEEHIVAILEEARVNILVTQAPYRVADVWDKTRTICAQVPRLEAVIAVDPAVFLPKDERSATDTERGDYLNEDIGVQVWDFDDLTGQHNGDRLDAPRPVDRDTLAAFFHTGGSTGRPKLARHSHGMQVANAWSNRVAMGLNERDVGLCGLPLFHVNAMMITGLAAFSAGAEIYIPSIQGYRDAALFQRFWELVETQKVSFFSGVPTVYSTLLQFPVEGRNVTSLRVGICGGAPMPVAVIEEFEALTGITILEGYGLTECTCTASLNPLRGERRVGSVGLRVPYVQVKSGHTDDAGRFIAECNNDEVGTIFVKGPNVTSGYKDESKNEGLLTDGWLNTGDLGRMDDDDYIWLTGRSKDLIIRGGHNIDPKTIEDAMHQHPMVELAAAVGRPDARLGEVPMIYVSLREDQNASEEELLAFAADHIRERAAVPKQAVTLDALPLTAIGKIYKPDLRRDAFRRVLEADLEEHVSAGAVTSIEVIEDPKYGLLARISLATTDETQHGLIERIVSRYQIKVKYDLSAKAGLEA